MFFLCVEVITSRVLTCHHNMWSACQVCVCWGRSWSPEGLRCWLDEGSTRKLTPGMMRAPLGPHSYLSVHMHRPPLGCGRNNAAPEDTKGNMNIWSYKTNHWTLSGSAKPWRTFHVADLMLTVRPLLVSVHFIRSKKRLCVCCSSFPFLEEPVRERNRKEMLFVYLLLFTVYMLTCSSSKSEYKSYY